MSGIIERIDYFSCGYCKNKMEQIFRETVNSEIKFPAGAFLIKHRMKGYILYDTGYSADIMKNKFHYMIYRTPNPIVMQKEMEIRSQLENNGIRKEEIGYIILSHLHPDHIGGIRQFPDAKFIITEKCYEEYVNGNFRSLIFKEFFPDDFENRLIIINDYEKRRGFPLKVNDLFKDGSLYLTSIDGHAKGQGCLFINERNLFIGADVSWGVELIKLTDKMKLIPRLIQDNFKEYKKGVDILKKLQKRGIKITVSHDPEERIRKILNEKDIYPPVRIYKGKMD